jgi:hypothetical protein
LLCENDIEAEPQDLPKPKVAIYGLTTEGYLLASRIIEKASVTIIDDTLQMAMELDQQMVKSHKDLHALVGEESLMGLKPIAQVLADSAVVFFTPKLRRGNDESVIEASTKLRDIAKYVSKGVLIVNTLPTGIGGNGDNVSLLEKQTGLNVGDSLNYAYCPLLPKSGDTRFLSVASNSSSGILEEIGLKLTATKLAKSELRYVSYVLEKTMKITTQIELMRRAREQKVSDRPDNEEGYIDELASYLYDLAAIQSSEDVGEPITYLASAAIKGLENYVRYIVDQTREMLRDLQLKASRTKVVIAWTIDKYEMKADRLRTAEGMVERMRDYVTDVEHAQSSPSDRGGQVLSPYKHNIVIVCSAEDYEWIRGLKKTNRGIELSILKATPSLETE